MPPLPPPPIMTYDWAAHEQTCRRLYIDEGKTLEAIMEHMKRAHHFTPSKRAFQMQFRRWNFPSKHHPAHNDDRLVGRIRELWEKNVTQREMLRVLTEEDGFDINARELLRVRARNRWLLRVPHGDRAEAAEEPGPDDDSALAAADMSTQRPARRVQQSPGLTNGSVKGPSKRQLRRTRPSADAAGSTIIFRFPSEMPIEEAQRILNLEPAAYRDMCTTFQRICVEQGVTKKTLAGPERWEAVKTRLARAIPQLSIAFSTAKHNPERTRLALDVICTHVTKRVRTNGTRMTLAEAKNLLGVNPAEAREMRVAFNKVLSERALTCKSEASPEQWEDIKRSWAERSHLVRRITDGAASEEDSQKRARALELLAKDVIKRVRAESRGRKGQTDGQQLPLSPAVSSQGMNVGDAVAGNAFDDMSDVSHASPMAFSSASSSARGARLPISISAPNMSGAQDAQSQSPRHLASSMPADMSLHSQMAPSLMLAATGQAASYMGQPYVQSHFAAETPSAAFPQAESASTACAVYMRAHPSSSLVADAGLWIATLSSPSVEELRRAAVDRFPGATCARVEGILRDAKGRELPLHIGRDEELSAYMGHLQGAAPTFSVQLAWKAS